MLKGDKQNSGTINRISAEVRRKISTGQVVVTLAGACKELVDNSIDAGATVIDIRVKNFGAELLEVSDNGTGIKSDDLEQLCKQNATSKLDDIKDFDTLKTFGFRGEALNALCALSSVTITTRHKSDDVGTKLTFDCKGDIIARECCAWPVGTLVTVKNLFGPLPVRRKELERTARREFNKLLTSVQALAFSRTDIRFCVNSVTNGKRFQALLSPGGNASVKDVIVSLFGTRAEKGAILEIIYAVPDESVRSLYSLDTLAKFDDIQISGYISSCAHGHGRSTNDRQFIFFNNRPVVYPKLCRIANEVYQMYNAGQYCMLILFITVPPDLIDVNVTPDKQAVYFEREKELLALLRSSLLATFVPVFGQTVTLPTNKAWERERMEKSLSFSQSQVQGSEAYSANSTLNESIGGDSIEPKDDISSFSSTFAHRVPAEVTYLVDLNAEPPDVNRKRRLDDNEAQPDCTNRKRNTTNKLEDFAFTVVPHIPTNKPSTETGSSSCTSSTLRDSIINAIKEHGRSDGNFIAPSNLSKIVTQTSKSDHFREYNDDDEEVFASDKNFEFINQEAEAVPPVTAASSEMGSVNAANQLNQEIDSDDHIGMRQRTQQNLSFSMERLKKCLQERLAQSRGNRKLDNQQSSLKRSSFIAVDSKVAEDELNTFISKDDFEQMEIVGQFNKGFIITRLRGDLFIVDQHASDEKYNFERFQKHARIQSQALLRPLPLGLGSFEESLLRDHLEVFNYNGFEFQINDNGECGRRILLTSIPVLHNWQFNTSDIDEMLSVLREFPGTMYRPTKLRKLFALRACRKSVMIGTALNNSNMEKIVRHLKGLNHPWNCPHGRPTLRHLCSLSVSETNTQKVSFSNDGLDKSISDIDCEVNSEDT